MGMRADLCQSQGRVHGWAVEGLHRPKEEARDSTKMTFVLRTQKTLVSIMETF